MSLYSPHQLSSATDSLVAGTSPIALDNKTLGRAQDPRANGAWLSKLTE